MHDKSSVEVQTLTIMAFFLDNETDRLKRHLIDELDYALLPTEAWEKLAQWYGVSEERSAIARQVVEHGMFVKHCKVEVYLVELKLCHNNDMETCQIRPFSRADNIGWYAFLLSQTVDSSVHA